MPPQQDILRVVIQYDGKTTKRVVKGTAATELIRAIVGPDYDTEVEDHTPPPMEIRAMRRLEKRFGDMLNEFRRKRASRAGFTMDEE